MNLTLLWPLDEQTAPVADAARLLLKARGTVATAAVHPDGDMETRLRIALASLRSEGSPGRPPLTLVFVTTAWAPDPTAPFATIAGVRQAAEGIHDGPVLPFLIVLCPRLDAQNSQKDAAEHFFDAAEAADPEALRLRGFIVLEAPAVAEGAPLADPAQPLDGSLAEILLRLFAGDPIAGWAQDRLNTAMQIRRSLQGRHCWYSTLGVARLVVDQAEVMARVQAFAQETILEKALLADDPAGTAANDRRVDDFLAQQIQALVRAIENLGPGPAPRLTHTESLTEDLGAWVSDTISALDADAMVLDQALASFATALASAVAAEADTGPSYLRGAEIFIDRLLGGDQHESGTLAARLGAGLRGPREAAAVHSSLGPAAERLALAASIAGSARPTQESEAAFIERALREHGAKTGAPAPHEATILSCATAVVIELEKTRESQGENAPDRALAEKWIDKLGSTMRDTVPALLDARQACQAARLSAENELAALAPHMGWRRHFDRRGEFQAEEARLRAAVDRESAALKPIESRIADTAGLVSSLITTVIRPALLRALIARRATSIATEANTRQSQYNTMLRERTAERRRAADQASRGTAVVVDLAPRVPVADMVGRLLENHRPAALVAGLLATRSPIAGKSPAYLSCLHLADHLTKPLQLLFDRLADFSAELTRSFQCPGPVDLLHRLGKSEFQTSIDSLAKSAQGLLPFSAALVAAVMPEHGWNTAYLLCCPPEHATEIREASDALVAAEVNPLPPDADGSVEIVFMALGFPAHIVRVLRRPSRGPDTTVPA